MSESTEFIVEHQSINDAQHSGISMLYYYNLTTYRLPYTIQKDMGLYGEGGWLLMFLFSGAFQHGSSRVGAKIRSRGWPRFVTRDFICCRNLRNFLHTVSRSFSALLRGMYYTGMKITMVDLRLQCRISYLPHDDSYEQ